MSADAPTPRHETGGDTPLREVAEVFVRLGLTAFGGPPVHVAMMEQEVVRRRGWVTRERFLDMLGACNLIPGPNSTELAIHLGRQRAGWRGLVVAGISFITPAAILTLVLAWAYVKYGTRPQAQALLYGIKPVIIAVVVQAAWGLSRTAVKSLPLAILGVLAICASAAGLHELAVLLTAGVGAALAHAIGSGGWRSAHLAIVAGPAGLIAQLASRATTDAVATVPFSTTALFLFFLKIGSILFGSGYVLLAFLQAGLVDYRHWLTEAQVLDAVAIGQVTPGPILSTATFVGYLLGGVAGAAVATIGIFLPSFCFVAASGPLIPQLRRSPLAGAFLDGVNVGAVALMAVVTLALARAAVVDRTTALLALVSAVLLLRYRISSVWLVGAGAVAGLLLGR